MNKKLLLIFLLPLILLSTSAIVSAKSYTIDKAFINITVNPDASLTFEEYFTYDFSGQFTYAYRDISLSSETISDIQVYDVTDGQYQQLTFEKTYSYFDM